MKDVIKEICIVDEEVKTMSIPMRHLNWKRPTDCIRVYLEDGDVFN